MNDCQCEQPAAFWNPYDGVWECEDCGNNADNRVSPDKPKIYPEMEYF